MKGITKREFLRDMGLIAAAGVVGVTRGDEYVPTNAKLPKGSIGDPSNPFFGRHVTPLEHTISDGPSCCLQGGKIIQPSREIPLFHSADVVVVGGGPAGFAAALAAARNGAKVALVERYGSLGGLFTNGMVLLMLATSVKEGSRYRLVTRGICEEFMLRARAMGPHVSTGAVPETRHWEPTVDPEGAKYLMDRMVSEAGIEMFFHSWGVDVVQDGNAVQGVVFESKQGRQGILAKVVVDCTGDADVLFQAGGDYRQITHAIGHVVRLGNIDRVTAQALPKDADGKVLPGKWPMRSNEGNGTTWWGYSSGGPTANGLDVRDLTKAEIAFRKEEWEHVEQMRKTPGWEQVYMVNSCSQIGPRATRLIAAESIVDRATYRIGKRPDDTVAVLGADGPNVNPLYVPYGQLLPKGVENLLCAGRCLGAGDTIDTFRLICPCFVTGEAAGTAAALAVAGGVTPRQLDVTKLQKTLERAKACLA